MKSVYQSPIKPVRTGLYVRLQGIVRIVRIAAEVSPMKSVYLSPIKPVRTRMY
jgi:hypothetical protein